NTKENKNRIFEKTASSKSKLIILMMIIIFCVITIPPALAYGDVGLLIVALIFPGIGFSVLFAFLFGNTHIVLKIFGLTWGLGFGLGPWIFVVLPLLIIEPIYLVGYIIGLLCVIGMFLCLRYLPKRTKYGNEILGKLRGFKNFLETAEKEKL